MSADGLSTKTAWVILRNVCAGFVIVRHGFVMVSLSLCLCRLLLHPLYSSLEFYFLILVYHCDWHGQSSWLCILLLVNIHTSATVFFRDQALLWGRLDSTRASPCSSWPTSSSAWLCCLSAPCPLMERWMPEEPTVSLTHSSCTLSVLLWVSVSGFLNAHTVADAPAVVPLKKKHNYCRSWNKWK